MDRNQVTGFILIFLILVVWSIINQPSEEEIQRAREKERIALEERDRKEKSEESSSAINPTPTFSSEPAVVEPNSQFGLFASSAVGSADIVTLENDVVKISLSSKGGIIRYAEIKDRYKILSKEGGETAKIPVRLFEDEKNHFNYQLNFRDRFINSSDLFFAVANTSNSVTFRATNSEGGLSNKNIPLEMDSRLTIIESFRIAESIQ